MIAKNFICLLTSISIITVFLCAIFSQYIALLYTQEQIYSYCEKLFQNEKVFSKQLTLTISSQFNYEMQKFSQYLYTYNMFLSKILSGNVIFKEPHISSQIHTELLYSEQENPKILALYRKSPFLTTEWYHQNITKIDQLPQQGQTLLTNLTRLDPYVRSLIVLNAEMNYRNSRYIKFASIFSAFANENILLLGTNNNTYQNIPKQPNCNQGKYKLDFKCRYWYQGTLSSESIQIFKPSIIYNQAQLYSTTLITQKMNRYDPISEQDTLNNISGLSVKLESIKEVFQNYAKSTVQAYLIDPVNQIVLYDSSQDFNLEKTAKSLSDVEFNYLQSKKDSDYFNQTLLKHFNQSFYERLDYINKKKQTQLENLVLEFPYNRNGTETYVLINPIYLIDKLPQFKGVKQSQAKGYKINHIFAQINIVSKEYLQQQSHDLQEIFSKYYTISLIIFIFFALISLFVTIIYSIKINKLFIDAIDHLTIILKNLSNQQKNNELHNILEANKQYEDIIFLSLETKELYQSFQMVFQQLIYSSDNFFLGDQTETLLKLYRNIEFFKQFKNHYAVGITHNNIGSILLQQGHYFQALEHFQISIMYAKYEIQNFIIQNPESTSAQLMLKYSFDHKIEQEQQQITKIKIGTLTINTSFNEQKYQQNKNNAKNQKNETSTFIAETEQDQLKPKSLFADKLCEIQNISNLGITCEKQELNIKNSQNLDSNASHKKTNQSLQNLSIQNVKDVQPSDQISKEQIDDFPDERIQLMSSIFSRKQNSIITLIAFQEQHDQLQDKNINKLNQNVFNFWKEIKNLLKDQMQICQYIPNGNFETVELLALIAKCQFNLNQQQKSDYFLNLSEIYLKNIQKTNQENQTIDQYETLHSEQRSTSQINQQYKKRLYSQNTNLLNDQNNEFNKTTRSKQKSIQIVKKPEIMQNNSQLYVNNTLKANLSNNDYSYMHKDSATSQDNNTQTFIIQENDRNISFFEEKQKILPLQSKESNKQGGQSQLTQENVDNLFITRRSEVNQKPEDKNQQNKQQDFSFQSFSNFKHPISRVKSNSFGRPIGSFKPQQKKQHTLTKQLSSNFEKEQPVKNQKNPQKNNQKGYSLHKYFEQRRETECRYEQNKSQYNYKGFEKEQLIYFIKSEYYIKIQNYIQAALILTSLFENYKNMMSYFPFKIVDKLKQVFDKQNINPKEFDEFQQKFNSNIQMNVVLIYSYKSEQNDNCFQSIQLLSDLVSTILTFQKDRISIMICNQEENDLQLYMSLMKVSQINQLLDKITLDIKNAITGQSIESLINFESYNIKIQNFNEKTQRWNTLVQDTYTKSEQNENIQLTKNLSKFMTKNYENQNNKSLQNQNTQNSDFNQDKNNLSYSFLQLNNESSVPIQTQQNDILNDLNDNQFQNTEHNHSYRFMKQNHQIEQTPNESFIQQKITQHDGDQLISMNHIESIKESKQKNIHEQNENFYKSIRSIINNCFKTQIVLRNFIIQQQMSDLKKHSKINDNPQPFNFLKFIRLASDLKEQQQKYIIFATNEITILDDEVFEKMCQILYYLNIQLIILLGQKGNNFLEQYTENGYEYEERIIIKIFYKCLDVTNYLQSQRHNITKSINPTIVQHY